jgi:hypothetical protein
MGQAGPFPFSPARAPAPLFPLSGNAVPPVSAFFSLSLFSSGAQLPPEISGELPRLGPARQWDRRRPTKSSPQPIRTLTLAPASPRGSPAPPPLFPPPPITSAPPWARRRTAPHPARACASTPPHHPGAPEPFTSDLGPFLGPNFPQSAATGKSSATEIARRR